MKTPPPLRPLVTRQETKVPGGFETDDDLSPTKSTYDDAVSSYGHSRNPSAAQKSTSIEEAIFSDGTSSQLEGSSAMLDEQGMSRKLLDVESSFMPDQSPDARNSGENDGLLEQSP